MIRYTLRCADGHAFESWFADAGAFDALQARGLVSCVECGSDAVEKALMAPRVRPGRRPAAAAPAPLPDAAPAPPPPGGAPKPLEVTRMEAAIAELRAKVEANSTYVGTRFAEEARAMNRGDKPETPIWGETTREEARALREEGVPAMPLPFGPKAKGN